MLKKRIIVDNLEINVFQSTDFDNKSPIIFLHGWGSDALSFNRVFTKCKNYIAVDLPGFGQSENPRQVWSVEDYAGFLSSFIKKFNIKNPIIVGHSFGGSIAIKYCSTEVDAKKLILIGSSGIRKRGLKLIFYNFIAKTFKIFFTIPPFSFLKGEARKKLYQLIGSRDYLSSGVLKESFKRIIKEDLTGDLKKIKRETSLIWGERDTETPLKQGLIMHKLIKDSKFYIIKEAGHYSFREKPQEFDDIFFKILNDN